MIDVGDTFVVVPAHVVGSGAASGLEIDSVFGWMYEFRDDQIVRFHAYASDRRRAGGGAAAWRRPE